MPKRDTQSLWILLADLARELSWTFRITFFGGLLLGLAYGLYLVSQVPAEEIRRGFLRALIVFVLGLTALGGFLGLVAGSLIELAMQALRSKSQPPGKPSRRPR